jgi:hypothetical protein
MEIWVLFYMENGCSAMVIVFFKKNRQFWFCHKFFESADQKSKFELLVKNKTFTKLEEEDEKSFSRICRYNFCFVAHDIWKA